MNILEAPFASPVRVSLIRPLSQPSDLYFADAGSALSFLLPARKLIQKLFMSPIPDEIGEEGSIVTTRKLLNFGRRTLVEVDLECPQDVSRDGWYALGLFEINGNTLERLQTLCVRRFCLSPTELSTFSQLRRLELHQCNAMGIIPLDVLLGAMKQWQSLEEFTIEQYLGSVDTKFPIPGRQPVNLRNLRRFFVHDELAAIRVLLSHMLLSPWTDVKVLLDCDELPTDFEQVMDVFPDPTLTPILDEATDVAVTAHQVLGFLGGVHGVFAFTAHAPHGGCLQVELQPKKCDIVALSRTFNSAIHHLPEFLPNHEKLRHLSFTGPVEFVPHYTWLQTFQTFWNVMYLAVRDIDMAQNITPVLEVLCREAEDNLTPVFHSLDRLELKGMALTGEIVDNIVRAVDLRKKLEMLVLVDIELLYTIDPNFSMEQQMAEIAFLNSKLEVEVGKVVCATKISIIPGTKAHPFS